MLTDIFMTTRLRPDLLRKSLESFVKNTRREDYRLTIVLDFMDGDSLRVLGAYAHYIDHLIVHNMTMGLGPSMNQALAYIDTMHRWEESPPLLTTYLQDDILYSPDWLPTLAQKFMQLVNPFHLGFASGIECVEHPVKKHLGNGLVLKDWIRATCMMSLHKTWMSMLPIPRIDPEHGQERGRPHQGLGSGVDWHFIRVHENSVCRTGRTNLVIPGLLQHIGFNKSSWLDRPLPESDSDKRIIEAAGLAGDNFSLKGME